MLNVLAVFLGGGIGAVLRYLTGVLFVQYLKFHLPLPTFVVNVVGCFILGFVYVLCLEKFQLNPALKLLITVGFCGGLTTFSTFSFEIFDMIQNVQYIHAALYTIVSLVIGVVAVLLGGYLCRIFIV